MLRRITLRALNATLGANPIALLGTALVAVLALSTLTACGRDWFGNDDPEPTPSAATCPVHDVEPPAEPDPLAPMPGRAIITLEVRAVAYPLKAGTWVDEDADYEWCVPVLLHVTGAATGSDGSYVVPDFRERSGAVRSTPWSGAGVTPWRADGVVSWDPDDAAPTVTVDLQASYDAARDITAGDPYRGPIAMRCAIYVNGHQVAVMLRMDVRDLGAALVTCGWSHSLESYV